ncbi:hypothetical protein VTL71DRAFT_15710 [Oculimacula yallundae]|uniref:DNA2/NAM7 helicase helicase domain-containing protein n=1 Tax=Oculimacula yallundae TaxID=86028 RepID=A0ABR4CI37_9HELO
MTSRVTADIGCTDGIQCGFAHFSGRCTLKNQCALEDERESLVCVSFLFVDGDLMISSAAREAFEVEMLKMLLYAGDGDGNANGNEKLKCGGQCQLEDQRGDKPPMERLPQTNDANLLAVKKQSTPRENKDDSPFVPIDAETPSSDSDRHDPDDCQEPRSSRGYGRKQEDEPQRERTSQTSTIAQELTAETPEAPTRKIKVTTGSGAKSSRKRTPRQFYLTSNSSAGDKQPLPAPNEQHELLGSAAFDEQNNSVKKPSSELQLSSLPAASEHTLACAAISDPEGGDVNGSTAICRASSSWTLYLPYQADLESRLYGIGEMFALTGHGKNLNQYLVNVYKDNRMNVEYIDRWTHDAPSKTIFLKVIDTTKPTKVRIDALNNLNPITGVAAHVELDDEDEYGNDELQKEIPLPEVLTARQKATLRGILIGLNNKPKHVDFFDGVSEENVQNLLNLCTEKQRLEIMSFVRKVPMGFLLLTGAPGSGKNTALITFILAHLLAGKAVGVYASANSAVNNIAFRTFRTIDKSSFINQREKLCLRVWSDQVESIILQGIDKLNIETFMEEHKSKSRLQPDEQQDDPDADKQQKVRQRVAFDFSISASAAVCMILGLLETDNVKLLQLRADNKHPTL